ncbi:MAG TPA: hypothetical protein VF992_06080 [Thermoplasmata archaeon]
MQKMDHCPICTVAVKPENLIRHLGDTHPRHPDMPRLREELKQEGRRVAPKKGARPIRLRKYQVAILALVVVGGVGGYYLISQPSGSNIVSACGLEGTVVHYHPLLVINHNGVQQPLPYDGTQSADIGYLNRPGFTNPKYYCAVGQIHWLHTHDGSGVIHVELPQTVSAQPTLGNFFEIWGEPLNPTTVWTFSGQVQAAMYNSDTGSSADFSSNPGSIPVYQPRAGPQGNEYAIPANLIFNGAYGSGASSGFFSGEIIWLNVTG